MKPLIGLFFNVIEKNLEGKTSLDILKPEYVEARKILMSAGVKQGSSLVNDTTSYENYLNSSMTLKDLIIEFGLSAVVLIATAASHTALTPCSGIAHIDTTPVFLGITSVYNTTTSTNSTSTNLYNNTPRSTAPGFGTDGFSPLHLALGNGHTNTVKRLVKHDLELARVPGREGITLLHYAVEKNDIDLLIYYLLMSDNKTVLGWRNEEGNTMMHLAALTNQSQFMNNSGEVKTVELSNPDNATVAKSSFGGTPLKWLCICNV
ncbi:unnamed protein product [Fraxinus pennsylvanica]|uniref:Uncharacterized protein n=1 Tax=Fraxinus pennsylvanica TaxID=56036 RepID=A0AAD2AEN1_9LAMI|nr:unnamed protein product [Fraxinus pennsylvanica]